MTLRQDIEAFVRARHEAQVGFLAELVRLATDNPPGDCAAHGARAAELLEGLGFVVERHAVPEALVREVGMVSVTNLVVRRRFGDGPTVALNAHGDVVPPGQGWTRDPYGAEIDDGRMFGRGAAVSKSDFATYAFALLALEALETPLNGAVELHFTYDEEAGGAVGPKWLLDQGVSRPDYAISAGFTYGVVTAHNGCLHLEVRVRGKQAHAALPHTGADALEAATGVLAAIYDHREAYRDIHSAVDGIDSPTLVVGLIEGGINTNVVPDLVGFRIDRRLIPEEDGRAVEAELKDLIEGVVARYPGTRCEVRRIMLAQPLAPAPGTEKLAGLLAEVAGEIVGEPIRTHGVPLYTDARHYASAGIPTVLYGAGPRSIGEANAHAGDEHLDLGDLRKATVVVALAVARLLGAGQG